MSILKFLAWALVLMIVFLGAAAVAYGVTHRSAPVAQVTTPAPAAPVAVLVSPTVAPSPTPDPFAQTSANPFDSGSTYQNPFTTGSYQNPY